MAAATGELRAWLQAFEFRELLVEGLGWNHDHAEPVRVEADGHGYVLERVAEKAGFPVYVCGPAANGAIPGYPIRRTIERQVAKLTYEHLIVFVDAARTEQVWQWVKRESGKPAACREHPFHAGQTGERLLQRLQALAVSLDEEAALSIAHVTARVRKAMDVEKVTKRFYERFRAELTAFQRFIDGITAQGDREWYASLMLNRMMFVYFIQKQGFLDGDRDYLRNRLERLRREGEGGRFQQFYRIFLLRLFHEGFGQPEADRAPELAQLLGKVPFLNGGLFDVHDLERDNPGISIPDEAFERVFGFFDGYQWHLDERPRRADNEINPDVLGYIFEKYINQKQMGAYYTREDITGYISRNTVIPFLFEAARKECPVAFKPGGGVWRLLQDDPDRYIYPSVAHGVAWQYEPDADPRRLEQPLDLPDAIAEGLGDVSKRGGWNEAAPAEYGLPTETWREAVARRRRHAEVRDRLAAGEVMAINDLITLNLDIERFARDVIVQSEGPELLRAFWHALHKVSILDPACGSGAFLFAALNILEPLYVACLEGMQGFLNDLERSERIRHPETMRDFREVLGQVEEHASEPYFILKSIVLDNLYGVDIMEEAVEICKLRLFLKLVAQLETYDQIEPLPDIDFNIRAGNTLVGFTSLEGVRESMKSTPDGQGRALFDVELTMLELIEYGARDASSLFDRFREQQTIYGGEITAADKANLRQQLESLSEDLNRYLAMEHGAVPLHAEVYDDEAYETDSYLKWRKNHKPFHWFAEFYGVMSKGGFDVVIGNPPYVASSSISYRPSMYASKQFPDIYAHVLLRSTALANPRARCGMIVPLSITFSRDFSSLRTELCRWGRNWFSSYDNIPAALFAGVSQRCTIWIGASSASGSAVSAMYRWRAAQRPHLMERLSYAAIDTSSAGPLGLPKLADSVQGRVLASFSHPRARKNRSVLGSHSADKPSIGFSTTARNFVSVFSEASPSIDATDLSAVSFNEGSRIALSDGDAAYAALSAISGEFMFWYWLVRGDGFHVTRRILNDYLPVLDFLPKDHYGFLVELGRVLDLRRNEWLVFKKNAGRYVGNFNYRGAYPITRRSDLLVLAALSRSREEALAIFEYVQRVLAINESAGEKGIPPAVKALFPAPAEDPTREKDIFDRIDKLLAEHYGFTDEELDFIINYDIKYQVGRER